MNTLHGVIVNVAWALVIACALFGVGSGFAIVSNATSAVQEIDGICCAMAFAVIPYVIARAISSFK